MSLQAGWNFITKVLLGKNGYFPFLKQVIQFTRRVIICTAWRNEFISWLPSSASSSSVNCTDEHGTSTLLLVSSSASGPLSSIPQVVGSIPFCHSKYNKHSWYLWPWKTKFLQSLNPFYDKFQVPSIPRFETWKLHNEAFRLLRSAIFSRFLSASIATIYLSFLEPLQTLSIPVSKVSAKFQKLLRELRDFHTNCVTVTDFKDAQKQGAITAYTFNNPNHTIPFT